MNNDMRPGSRNTLFGVALCVLGVIVLITLSSMKGNMPPSTATTASSTAATSTATAATSTGAAEEVFPTGGTTVPPAPPASGPPSRGSTAALLLGMKMTFDDEFNTFSRYTDANGNVTCNPGGIGRWQTVYNFCSRTNSANDEAEVYIDPGFLAFLKKESAAASESDSDNPFSVSGGILSIKAAPSSPQVLAAVGSWAKYTSGLITTQFSFSQEYGYFEIRAALPKGAGLWPAFWLLPESGAWPPEIDAMEAFGAASPSGQGGLTMIHYASHAVHTAQSCGAWADIGTDITQGFHTYGVDIEPTGITYYFDGNAYATCPPNPDVDTPMYMLINLAVGGPGSWPGIPNASNSWPAVMQIDYVRAYQKI